ncbi:MAG TPA: DNA internalization-related competence protein ComEC/Rec2 [Candidatus Binatia bacterium]|nr:DNA internalization-related competence protein ComEC/Rec2 [Candidatus Binatia bacterium]
MADREEAARLQCRKIHPSAWLIVPTLFLLLGQALAVAPWQLPGSGWLAVAPFVLLPFYRRWRGWTILGLLVILAFAIGYVRHREILLPQFPENHLRSVMLRHEQVLIEGQLKAEPENLINRHRWLLRAERIWHPTGAEEISGDLQLSLRNARRDWRYGDRIRFWLRPNLPQNSGNPGGFDYATYLSQRQIYVTGFLENDAAIALVAREPGALRGAIEDIRRTIRRYIDVNFSPDGGALMKALTVGETGGIRKEVRNAFTAAGVNHVLSISGLHVAMLGVVIFAAIRYGLSFSSYVLLRFNLLKAATLFSFLAVVFYTALAGAMVPTVRSAIMIGVYQLAVLLDREEEVFASLTLAALLIALVWPGVVADISFQLSFLAVLFIAWGMRNLYHGLTREKSQELSQEKSWIRDKARQLVFHLVVPLLATLGTGPLIAHYFGNLSLAGFVTNPVIVPLVGFVVVPLGLFVGLLTLIANEFAGPLVWLADRLANWTIIVVEYLGSVPLASFRVAAPNLLEVGVLYGGVIAFFVLRKRSHIVSAAAIFLLLLAGDVFYWRLQRYDSNRLRITHLNVGQGDAAVVELPGGKILVIDAGGTAVGDFDTGESIVAPYLRSRKILKIDYLLVSHARIDHYGGMRALAQDFSPNEFWSGAAKGATQRFEDLEETLERLKMVRRELTGDLPCRDIAPVRLCFLFGADGNVTESPVVVRLEYGKASFLFASDIDKREELELSRKRNVLGSTVVKVPRHGSPTASSAEFIAAVRPKLAILSAGARSRAEAKRDEVVERYRAAGAEVLRTYEDGAIILETDGETIRYSGFKSGISGKLVL